MKNLLLMIWVMTFLVVTCGTTPAMAGKDEEKVVRNLLRTMESGVRAKKPSMFFMGYKVDCKYGDKELIPDETLQLKSTLARFKKPYLKASILSAKKEKTGIVARVKLTITEKNAKESVVEEVIYHIDSNREVASVEFPDRERKAAEKAEKAAELAKSETAEVTVSGKTVNPFSQTMSKKVKAVIEKEEKKQQEIEAKKDPLDTGEKHELTDAPRARDNNIDYGKY